MPGDRPATPLVTVIIATYNGAATLRSCLASVCAQQWSDFEAWVVGDASTDDSEAVVASMRDDRLHWANLARNSGSQSAANNEGLRRARGTYVAYLGHDDLWFPWHLEALVSAIRADDADLVHGMTAMLDAHGVAGVVGSPPPNVSYAHHFVPPSSWLHRRDLVDLAGWWAAPEATACGVDLDYSRRVFAAHRRFSVARRLSVLKFPSPWFRAYAADAIRPQAGYLRRMQENAPGLEHDVLTQLADILARDQATPGARPDSDLAYLRQALRIVARRRVRDPLMDWGPTRGVERWRFQRHRRRMRSKRGLT